jgi:hypothetical protein
MTIQATRRKRRYVPFTPEEDRRIGDGLRAGLTFNEIARRMGRDGRSVVRRADRMDLRPPLDPSADRADRTPAPDSEALDRFAAMASHYCRASRDVDEAVSDEAIDRAMRRLGRIENGLLNAAARLNGPPRTNRLAMAALRVVRLLNSSGRTVDPRELTDAHDAMMRIWRGREGSP